MSLEQKDIEHIAKLARLYLTQEEINKYGSQLSAVLGYIDQLSEVETDDAMPTAQVTGLENVFRVDAVHDWDSEERASALKLAPDFEDDQVKVKRVL